MYHDQATRAKDPPDARHSANAATDHELAYLVAGMTCEHCKVAVTEEVPQVAGVAAVDVDLDAKRVRRPRPRRRRRAVVAAIDEAGYDAVAA